MNQNGENKAVLSAIILIVVNVIGLGIPSWYNKDHEHTVNATIEKPNCMVHVNIREGLWQRYCVESMVEDCALDVQGI